MPKVALLYTATGPYNAFWEDFYTSFEKKFLPGYEKEYFYLTDAKEFYQMDNPRVHYYNQEHFPWPIVTLLKFHNFLKLEDQLLEFDYVFNFNANTACNTIVRAEEILPRPEMGERLVFVEHPGIYLGNLWKKPYRRAFERSRKSKCYVPYCLKSVYVIAAVGGGIATEYVKWMHEICDRLDVDLKHNVIPVFHDESCVNHYVASHNDYRLLDPGFYGPDSIADQFEIRIHNVDKAEKFDVVAFKNTKEEKKGFFKRKWDVICWYYMHYIHTAIRAVLDGILGRKPAA